MAGIGFELRKLIEEDTFSGDFKAYFFAGIVSSGPWIISILCLGVLWMFSAPMIGPGIPKAFQSDGCVYVCIFSYNNRCHPIRNNAFSCGQTLSKAEEYFSPYVCRTYFFDCYFSGNNSDSILRFIRF